MIEFVIAATGMYFNYSLNVPFTMTVVDARINSKTQVVNVGTITSGFEYLSASFSESSATITLQRVSGSGQIRPQVSLKLSSDYAVSSIQMWKNKDFLYSENNYHIDNIANYLGTPDFPADSVLPAKLQYVEFKPKITVRLDMNQSNIQFGSDQNWNYCKITRHSNKVDSAYFFIKKISWKAVNTIELELEMDVLNTFTWNSDYTVSDKTLVRREHKDRWTLGDDAGLYVPLIDFTSEGIQPTLFKKFECDMYAEEDSPDGVDLGSYYLIYRSHTSDENSPVDIFLCRDGNVEVDLSAAGYTGDFVLKEYYIGVSYSRWGAIYSEDTLGIGTNVGAKVTFVFYDAKKQPNSFTWTLGSNECIRFSDRMVEQGTIDASGFHLDRKIEYKKATNRKLDSIYLESVVKVRTYNPGGDPYNDSWWTPAHIATLDVVSGVPAGLSTNLGSISDIDRTDPLLLKIVKLPYPPCAYHFNSSGVIETAPSGWKISQNITDFPDMLEYIDSGSTKCLTNWFFMYPDEDFEDEFFSPYDAFAQRSFTMNVDDNKSMDYESKLLHSDYFQQKFVYDSFAYTFQGEQMSEGIDSIGQFSLQFYVSLTMSSKFAFSFPSWYNALRADTQDYSALLYVARNNEIPVYNSAYLNYIRTGYNYDIKTRNRQLASNVVGSALSTAGAIASFVAAPATYGASAAAGVALAVGAAGSTYKAIADTAQADQNIAQKLHAAEMQGLSVIGSDDVDIMSAYTDGNKAKIVVYEVSEKMKKNLFDLFYYTGYICNENKVPAINTRYWFNFIQCDLVCNSWKNIPIEIQEVVKRKFAEGVTFFHSHLSGLTRVWNLEQTKENWEESLV